jgi:hypothetical protein
MLETRTGEATRIVDKSPVNSGHLGAFHSVFPNARIIYMQPIHTCLSCYFQKFAGGSRLIGVPSFRRELFWRCLTRN